MGGERAGVEPGGDGCRERAWCQGGGGDMAEDEMRSSLDSGGATNGDAGAGSAPLGQTGQGGLHLDSFEWIRAGATGRRRHVRRPALHPRTGSGEPLERARSYTTCWAILKLYDTCHRHDEMETGRTTADHEAGRPAVGCRSKRWAGWSNSQPPCLTSTAACHPPDVIGPPCPQHPRFSQQDQLEAPVDRLQAKLPSGALAQSTPELLHDLSSLVEGEPLQRYR